MIIGISSTGKELDSQIDPRFGRCSFFVICDTETMKIDVFDNDSIALSGGAGIQSAQFIAEKGVEAILTGNCGPNAVKTLNAAGIKLFLGQSGSVGEAIARFKSNTLSPSNEANVSDHFGMNQSPASTTGKNADWNQSGGGMGKGTGRGMGMGRGKGMGRGSNIATGSAGMPVSENLSEEQELNRLKDQSNELKKQIEDIQARIDRIEKK